MLDFSRIEKGKKSFRMQVGDPAPVVRDVAEVLRPYLKEKGFELALEVPESLPACSFDKDALTQILASDFYSDDRRRVVGAGVRHGREAEILDMRALVGLEITDATTTVIATRGERLVAHHTSATFAERKATL